MKLHPQNAIALIASYAASTSLCSVFAHEGHGLAGSHWHVTDTLGFLAVFGVAAWALWLARKGK